mgnify:CR=1 FL=1
MGFTAVAKIYKPPEPPAASGFTPVGAATALPALVCGWLPPPQRIFRKGFAPFGAGADSGNQGSLAGWERAIGRHSGHPDARTTVVRSVQG